MSLGSRFPPEFFGAHLKAQLTPGRVIKLCAVMDDGKQKEKRFIVLHVDAFVAACVINSRPARLLLKQQELSRCQVSMPVSGHPFMDHDSWIDCSKGRRYALTDVLAQLSENPKWMLGVTSVELRKRVCEAISVAPTVRAIDKQVWIQALRGR